MEETKLLYNVRDRPPILVTLVFGLQVAVLNVAGIISMVTLYSKVLCGDDALFAKLTGTYFFVAGFGTFLQTTLGLRLPIFQGPSGLFLVPLLNIGSLPEWQCATNTTVHLGAENSSASTNATDLLDVAQAASGNSLLLTTVEKIQLFEGSLLAASVLHIFLGATGIMSRLMKYIGPLTIAPTIALIGVYLVDVVINMCSVHWGIAAFTVLIFLICAGYLQNVNLPVPNRRCHRTSYPVFRVYAITIAMGVGWLMAYILTVAGALSDDPKQRGFQARTDAKTDGIYEATWFYFPYPGQFGGPRFSLVIFLGLCISVVMSIIESLGDYVAVSRMCNETFPPPHALSRGVLVEGVISLFSGAFGLSQGMTSYSQMISIIGITRVGSRLVFQVGGILLMVFGVIGKLNAVWATIPLPVVGGLFLMLVCGISGVGLSALQAVNFKSFRNILIIGMSMIIGILIPRQLQLDSKIINTGTLQLDHTLTALLKNAPFVGGLCGFFLDLTLPGKRSQFPDRLTQTKIPDENAPPGERYDTSVYDLPFLPKRKMTASWLKYVPFLPDGRS